MTEKQRQRIRKLKVFDAMQATLNDSFWGQFADSKEVLVRMTLDALSLTHDEEFPDGLKQIRPIISSYGLIQNHINPSTYSDPNPQPYTTVLQGVRELLYELFNLGMPGNKYFSGGERVSVKEGPFKGSIGVIKECLKGEIESEIGNLVRIEWDKLIVDNVELTNSWLNYYRGVDINTDVLEVLYLPNHEDGDEIDL